MTQHPEIQHHDGGDKRPQHHQELALRHEVGLAGFVDELGNLEHAAVHGQVLQAHIDGHAESQPEKAKQDSDQQQLMAVNGIIEKADRRKVGQFQCGFAAAGFLGGLGKAGGGYKQESRESGGCFRNPAARGRNMGGQSAYHNFPQSLSSGVTVCFAPEVELPSAYRRPRPAAGVPTTLPPQGIKLRSADLAASEYHLCRRASPENEPHGSSTKHMFIASCTNVVNDVAHHRSVRQIGLALHS